jgi:hypothetical protein
MLTLLRIALALILGIAIGGGVNMALINSWANIDCAAAWR